jgi:calpain-7
MIIGMTTTDLASTRHLRLSVQGSAVGDDSPEVWVLLSRHITDSSKKSDFMALHVDIEDRHTASPSEIDKVAQKVCLVPEA